MCSDVYKVGGFIDENKPSTDSKNTDSQNLDNTKTYVQQQKSLYEDFDPIQDRLAVSKDTTFKTALPHTTPSPCSGMDDETKKLLNEFAKKPNGDSSSAKAMENETASNID